MGFLHMCKSRFLLTAIILLLSDLNACYLLSLSGFSDDHSQCCFREKRERRPVPLQPRSPASPNVAQMHPGRWRRKSPRKQTNSGNKRLGFPTYCSGLIGMNL